MLKRSEMKKFILSAVVLAATPLLLMACGSDDPAPAPAVAPTVNSQYQNQNGIYGPGGMAGQGLCPQNPGGVCRPGEIPQQTFAYSGEPCYQSIAAPRGYPRGQYYLEFYGPRQYQVYYYGAGFVQPVMVPQRYYNAWAAGGSIGFGWGAGIWAGASWGG